MSDRAKQLRRVIPLIWVALIGLAAVVAWLRTDGRVEPSEEWLREYRLHHGPRPQSNHGQDGQDERTDLQDVRLGEGMRGAECVVVSRLRPARSGRVEDFARAHGGEPPGCLGDVGLEARVGGIIPARLARRQGYKDGEGNGEARS